MQVQLGAFRTYLGSFDIAAAAAGLYADVPVMLGANSADALTRPQDKDKIFAAFGECADEARAIYDPDGSKTWLEVAVQVSADQRLHRARPRCRSHARGNRPPGLALPLRA